MVWRRHIPKGMNVQKVIPYQVMFNLEKETVRAKGQVPGQRPPEQIGFGFDPLARQLLNEAGEIYLERKRLLHNDIHQHADVFLRYLVMALNRVSVEGMRDRSGQLARLRPIWANYRNRHQMMEQGRRAMLWMSTERMDELSRALECNEQNFFAGNPIGDAHDSIKAVRLLKEIDMLMHQRGLGAYDEQMEKWSAFAHESVEHQVWSLLKTAEPVEKNRHSAGYL